MRNWKTCFAAAMAISVVTHAADAAEVTEALDVHGDMRLRFETIDAEGKDTRNRWRVRARAGVKAKVNDELKVGVRLATGDDDPVSRNETLDSGFTPKSVGFDKAYFSWKPETLGGIEIIGGKQSVPFVKIKDLVWDGDLTPEGVALKKSVEASDALGIDLAAGAFSAEERSSDSDTWLLGAQAVANIKASDTVSILGGAGVFHYDNMKGFATLVDSTDGFGNDVTEVTDEDGEVTETMYASDFTEVNVLGKVKIKTAIPVAIYADYVVNTEADTEDTGIMFGATLGKAKAPGSAQFDYNFRDLEANAVVGAFTDSDSGGGGTGVEGHKFQAKYQINDGWQFAATYFINEVGSKDYERGQLDLIAKF